MGNQAATGRKDSTDRISRLPESVLHHISCFLSQKKAVQTSVLSKIWRHLGPTQPVIDLRGACDVFHAGGNKFCEECYNGNNEKLLSVVNNTFQRYHHLNLSAQEIRLEMLGLDSQSISILEKWISIFINPDTRVTTFRLSIDYYYNSDDDDDNWTRLELPSSVFKAGSLKDLYLINCKISSIENAVLKNLRKLRLIKAYVDDETLGKVMSGCPFIEYAELQGCKGLKTFSVANENQYLKDFKFYAGGILQSWKLDRDNYLPHVKSLYLYNVHLSTESLEIFSCNFPLLEEFTLDRCNGFQEIKLFCPSLKHLTIELQSSIKLLGSGNIILNNSRLIYDDALLRFLKAISQSQISLDISKCMLYKEKQPAGYQIKQIDRGLNDPVIVEHLSSFRGLVNSLSVYGKPSYLREKIKDIVGNNIWRKGALKHTTSEKKCGTTFRRHVCRNVIQTLKRSALD